MPSWTLADPQRPHGHEGSIAGNCAAPLGLIRVHPSASVPAFITVRPGGIMAKLKLDLDSLAVESFDTDPQDHDEGTVHGAQATLLTCASCVASCQYSCEASCRYTCPRLRTCGASCVFTCLGPTCYMSCFGTCDPAFCRTWRPGAPPC